MCSFGSTEHKELGWVVVLNANGEEAGMDVEQSEPRFWLLIPHPERAGLGYLPDPWPKDEPERKH